MMKPRRIFRRIALCFFALCITALTAGIIYIAQIDYIPLNAEIIEIPKYNISLYSEKGSEIHASNIKFGHVVDTDELPDYVLDAFIAIEDKRFYKHNGLDYKRIISAAYKNASAGEFKEGGSTITQQLAKITHLSSDKTIERKLIEAKLAKEIEQKFTKKQILRAYLNSLYFGCGAYGIQAASYTFFNKPAACLTITEAASLAAVINSPRLYSPVENPNKLTERRNIVLRLMRDYGTITDGEYQTAINEPMTLDMASQEAASYFMAVFEEAQKLLPEYLLNNCKIYTFYDEYKQSAAAAAVSSVMTGRENVSGTGADFAVLSVSNDTCGVNAYYSNRADMYYKKRQPGSAIKPVYVYAPAFEKNIISPATLVMDDEVDFEGYSPQNYGNKHEGWMSVRRAVESSNNVVAVKVLDYVGIPYAKQFAGSIGLDFDPSDDGYATALGGMTTGLSLRELVSAYAAFPNLGKYCPAGLIKKITSSNGETLYAHSDNKFRRFREDTAYLMTDIMRTTAKEGTAKLLKPLPFDIASKTGTVRHKDTEFNSDSYNMFYTAQDTAGIWIGNCSNADEYALKPDVTGGKTCTLIAKSYAERIYENDKPPAFKVPESVKYIDIDRRILKSKQMLSPAGHEIPERYRDRELFSVNNLPKAKR